MTDSSLPPWVVPVAVPIILALITAAVTWLVAANRAKVDRLAQQEKHSLELAAQQEQFTIARAAQQAEFDGKKKAAALARDQQLYDTQQRIIDQLQENQRESQATAQRSDEKIDSLYVRLGQERDYANQWEAWHSQGQPDPPGRPYRRASFDARPEHPQSN